MDDAYNLSVLDDIDAQLEYGNEMIDPFNVLNVQMIHGTGKIYDAMSNIDNDKLFAETKDFNITPWEFILGNEFMLIEPEEKELYIRLAWWLCREYMYSVPSPRRINLIDILSKDLNSYAKVFIYSSKVDYYDNFTLVFTFENDAQLTIKFKDDAILV